TTVCFFFQAEDGIRGRNVTGVQTCALPIWTTRPRTDDRTPHTRPAASGRGGRWCSSDGGGRRPPGGAAGEHATAQERALQSAVQIGRASGRERGWAPGGGGLSQCRAEKRT